MSEAAGKIHTATINLAACSPFVGSVRHISDMAFGSLMDKADARWEQMRSALKQAEFEATIIGPIAQAASLSWPSTRFNDAIGIYLDFENPKELLAARGMGAQKVRTLLSIILGLHQLVDSGMPESEPSQNRQASKATIIPEDPTARVEMFWSRIREKISKSEIVQEKLGDLARQWGIPWPTNSKIEYIVGDVIKMDSLSHFMRISWGLGKKKKTSIANVIWRAWTEVEPDGPAGPSKSGIEIAREEFEALARHSDVLAIIHKCLDLAGLKERERSILQRRYGLISGTPMTLEEIGQTDLVTRERIRQVQQLAENKITGNQTSDSFLRLALDKELPDVLRNLENYGNSPLLRFDGDWHRSLPPAHSFLIEVIHKDVHQFLDRLYIDGVIQKTSVGWWIGKRLSDDCAALADSIMKHLIAENRPLSLTCLAERGRVSIEQLRDAACSIGLQIEMGYIFQNRLAASERRCLFALSVAANHQRWLWSEIDFYQAAKTISEDDSGSLRLLVRDVECIPGVAIDLPGPFVVINPCAAKACGMQNSTSGASLKSETDYEEDQDPTDSMREGFQGMTTARLLEALMSRHRILKYEKLENLFCEARIAPPGSLGPTLLTKPQFVRYAPAYWGLGGLALEESDIEQLCNEDDLLRYVRSKRLGGLNELFPFWCPAMEYRWCRWAERHTNEDLYYSLLAVCEPESWPLSEPIRMQWLGKKARLGISRLPAIQGNLDMAYIEFEEIYGLVHLVSQRGSIGPATIPHYYGLREADRKALGTMALLGALGILVPRMDMDSPWAAGCRVEEWLQTMSELHYRDPLNSEARWMNILDKSIKDLDPTASFGWYTGEELQESYARWKA